MISTVITNTQSSCYPPIVVSHTQPARSQSDDFSSQIDTHPTMWTTAQRKTAWQIHTTLTTSSHTSNTKVVSRTLVEQHFGDITIASMQIHSNAPYDLQHDQRSTHWDLRHIRWCVRTYMTLNLSPPGWHVGLIVPVFPALQSVDIGINPRLTTGHWAGHGGRRGSGCGRNPIAKSNPK